MQTPENGKMLKSRKWENLSLSYQIACLWYENSHRKHFPVFIIFFILFFRFFLHPGNSLICSMRRAVSWMKLNMKVIAVSVEEDQVSAADYRLVSQLRPCWAAAEPQVAAKDTNCQLGSGPRLLWNGCCEWNPRWGTHAKQMLKCSYIWKCIEQLCIINVRMFTTNKTYENQIQL